MRDGDGCVDDIDGGELAVTDGGSIVPKRSQ